MAQPTIYSNPDPDYLELGGFARELKESVDEIWKKQQIAEAEGKTTAGRLTLWITWRRPSL